MKVYFASAGYDSCYYVRCMLPLQAGGWWGDITTLRGIKTPPDKAAQAAMQADVIVFQRPMQEAHIMMIKTLKNAGKKVVFDNDDTYIKDSGIPHVMKHIEGIEEKVDALLDKFDANLKLCASLCDMVTVTTPFLAKEYAEVNKNVLVLPNCVNPDDWDEPIPNTTGKIRVGISGSVASSLDYEYAKPLIQKLSKMDNVQIVLFGLPPDTPEFAEQRASYKEDIEFWSSVNAEWYGWVGIEDYQDQLNQKMLDICLIPRLDNYFNRCKSPLKYLEHSMYKIPCVCQSFSTKDSPYDGLVEHGVTGFLAQTQEEWEEYTMKLINDAELRKTIGQNAYNYVVDNFNINNRITEWETAYQSLCEK